MHKARKDGMHGRKVMKGRGKPGQVGGNKGPGNKKYATIGPVKQNFKARHRKGLPNTKVISAMW